MTIGRPDLKVSYPERMAFYPVSVRHNNSSPTASFRFPVTRDTLAFGYKIPVITVLLGLGAFIPHTLKIYYMPGTPIPYALRAKRKISSMFDNTMIMTIDIIDIKLIPLFLIMLNKS